jgi:hypothetical protein
MDALMRDFEARSIYTAYIMRPLRWIKQKQESFHNSSPLDRYHSYFEQVVAAGSKPTHDGYNGLMSAETYPIDMVIVSLHLKQEYRNFSADQSRYYL